jgi:hypothetical protein
MAGEQLPRQSTSRLKCQVCGRMLAAKSDGTSWNHYSYRYPATIVRADRSYCPGSGFQLARWKPRQQLRHHSGDIWEVVGTSGPGLVGGDYFIRCVSGREAGREMVAHGEYMHRHGWTPLPRDLMADLEESLAAVHTGEGA